MAGRLAFAGLVVWQRAWRVGFAAAGLVLLLAYGAAFVVASLRLLLDAGEPEPETPTYWTAP